jgi:hypothetical protein
MPGSPSNPQPADGSVEVILNPVLSWSPAEGAITYNLCFGTTNPPEPYIQNLTDTSFELPDSLDWNTEYFWEIGVVNTIGTTPGPIWSFTTIANDADDPRALVPNSVRLGPVYPNPFNAQLSIPFSVPQMSGVRLELFDILGRSVAVLANQPYSAGPHIVQWNSERVGTGVYLLKLTAGNTERVTKVIALK